MRPENAFLISSLSLFIYFPGWKQHLRHSPRLAKMAGVRSTEANNQEQPIQLVSPRLGSRIQVS